MTALLILAGVVALFGGSFLACLVIGRGIRIADQAAAPRPNEAPTRAPIPVLTGEVIDPREVRRDDELVEALAAGRAVLDDDPHLTRLITVWRDEARDGT